MPEGLGQSSSGSFDGHDPALHADVHALGDDDLLVGIQNIHLGFERRLRPKVVGKS